MTHKTDAQGSRRDFLKTVGLGSAAVTITGSTLPVAPVVTGAAEILSVDPRPRFDLSPYLYMQFMEPLGVTDSSVDAAWDFGADRWREDVVSIDRYGNRAWRDA